MINHIKPVIFVLASATPLLLLYYMKKKEKDKTHDCTTCYFKCVFNTLRNADCRRHIMKNYKCSADCSVVYVQELLTFINSAKKTISICMYTLTLDSVFEALLEAHSNKIIVRVITDIEMARHSSSKINSLKNSDVPVKVQPVYGSLMHHKFCLIDEADDSCAKMFFGSTNLTLQGFSSNWDQIIYTNNYSIIRRFSEEFECLWKEF